MKTELDVFHDLLLQGVIYDGSSLTVTLKCVDSLGAAAALATLTFQHCCLHLVAEALLDSEWGFPAEGGFLKVFTGGDVRKVLAIENLPFLAGHLHYRIHARDEIVHAFARPEPAISVAWV